MSHKNVVRYPFIPWNAFFFEASRLSKLIRNKQAIYLETLQAHKVFKSKASRSLIREALLLTHCFLSANHLPSFQILFKFPEAIARINLAAYG